MGTRVFGGSELLSRHLSEGSAGTELGGRCTRWKLHPNDYGAGVDWEDTQIAGSARGGAVLHPGFAGETHVYADL